MRKIVIICAFILDISTPKNNILVTKQKCIDTVTKKDTFKNWSINSKPKNQWSETDWLAKMMMSEVSDSTKLESIYLVGIVAKNHTHMMNMGMIDVITRPRAFSGVNHPTYHWWKVEPTTVHKRLAQHIINNKVPKHLENLYSFCVLDWISEKSKKWFLSLKIYKKIDNVTFFINEKV